ncbi:MAG: hypothetical protein ACMVP2_02805 [Imperialibacter sp.]|uniref:hypothetical protein n=1 Tax=Imperialibacter sp. TaxID=2038411 RepID=UPI003A85E0E2
MKKGLVISIPLLIFWIIWLTWRALAPANSLKKLEQFALSTSDAAYDSIYSHPDLIEITREAQFKRSLLALKKDSIHLIVDLKDSMVGLYINGVIIHRIKPDTYYLDPVLSNLSNRAYMSLFGPIIPISTDTASIVKEPVVVRQAPKDTIEAASNAYKPDTLMQNPAFWLIQLPGEIDLVFSQATDKTPLDTEVRDQFNEFIRSRYHGESLSRFLHLSKSTSPVQILVSMPVDDLRAIYRALPVNGKLVLRY